ncbi:type III toxin-antitoxin system TenpIN family toxin [Parablautia muri]|uniref:Uncharacterized protein n=1 Tax=Parablautia muri TaxID=2320879 RepID=A0A9X5BI26_9FIRM|nr:hypothetical protein [Parablautia muri]NBJ94146.1 hypothetical protein [Parablautia muri]
MCSKEDSFDYQVLNLTNSFYSDYPDPPYKEIVRKNSRPYNCLLVQSHYGYFICIPYRSHINHKYAFRFKKSIRSKRANSGLDYSKIVIIKKGEYIGTTDAKKSRSVEDMGRIYDDLTEESKKKACEELLSKKKFFEDACLKIMDSFKQEYPFRKSVRLHPMACRADLACWEESQTL